MVASSLRCRHALALAALLALAACAASSEPQPWSPEADKIYHQIYHPIIDGG